jgi:hypothetical protein
MVPSKEAGKIRVNNSRQGKLPNNRRTIRIPGARIKHHGRITAPQNLVLKGMRRDRIVLLRNLLVRTMHKCRKDKAVLQDTTTTCRSQVVKAMHRDSKRATKMLGSSEARVIKIEGRIHKIDVKLPSNSNSSRVSSRRRELTECKITAIER